jgi:hypothetical protein
MAYSPFSVDPRKDCYPFVVLPCASLQAPIERKFAGKGKHASGEGLETWFQEIFADIETKGANPSQHVLILADPHREIIVEMGEFSLKQLGFSSSEVVLVQTLWFVGNKVFVFSEEEFIASDVWKKNVFGDWM